MRDLTGKRILITGAAGTIGRELISLLSRVDVEEIRAVDNNESGLQELADQHAGSALVQPYFGDIRDLQRLTYLCRDSDVVLHTAAIKHVGVGETNPLDAVKTNVDGTANVIQAAVESDRVELVVYTSSDKAVNPTNVMGTTKLLGERLMTSAMNLSASRRIAFTTTRFGNVLGSQGSVIPIFLAALRSRGQLPITDPSMTRFVMSIRQAAELVIRVAREAQGGELFVSKMPVVRIPDLADAVADLVADSLSVARGTIEQKVIGKRPGEKLYEELMTIEESERAFELADSFLVSPAIPPRSYEIDFAQYDGFVDRPVSRPYISTEEDPMSLAEVTSFLTDHRVIELPTSA